MINSIEYFSVIWWNLGIIPPVIFVLWDCYGWYQYFLEYHWFRNRYCLIFYKLHNLLSANYSPVFVFKRSIFQTFWRLHCCPKFLFFELETSNSGLFFHFVWLCKVSERLDNIYIRHFTRAPPLMLIVFLIYQKFKGKLSTINVVQSFWNFAQSSKMKK